MIPSSNETAPPVLYSFTDKDNLSLHFADFVIKTQDEAIEKRGRFTIALSGGSMPKIFAKEVVGSDKMQWDKWQVFFADERLVPLDDADSNYLANYNALFSHVPIPSENIHTINLEHLKDPEECAEDYEQKMIGTFVGKDAVAFPRFDLIVLGIGPDGHTCSLFPDHALLNETASWVASIEDSPKPPPTRITFTYPILNHAHNVAFLAAGADKSNIIAEVLDHPEKKLPASGIKPVRDGRVYYFTDDAASSKVQFVKSDFKL